MTLRPFSLIVQIDMVIIKLTELEQSMYDTIIKCGTMQDMFDIAYLIGRERVLSEMVEEMQSKKLEKQL